MSVIRQYASIPVVHWLYIVIGSRGSAKSRAEIKRQSIGGRKK